MGKVRASSSLGQPLLVPQFTIEEIENYVSNNLCKLMNKTKPRDQILWTSGQRTFNAPQPALSQWKQDLPLI